MTNTQKLKGCITAAGYTQARVAEKLGISITALNNKINNKSEFTASEIATLAEMLHLSRDDVDEIFFKKQVD